MNDLSERLIDSSTGKTFMDDSPKYYLLFAFTTLLETCGALLFKRALDSIYFLAFSYTIYFLSLTLFLVVLQKIPLFVAYSVWSISGTVMVCVMSRIIYGEEIST